MQKQNEFKPGTSFVIDPIKGIAIPEEQYAAEQAAKTPAKTPTEKTLEEPDNGISTT